MNSQFKIYNFLHHFMPLKMGEKIKNGDDHAEGQCFLLLALHLADRSTSTCLALSVCFLAREALSPFSRETEGLSPCSTVSKGGPPLPCCSVSASALSCLAMRFSFPLNLNPCLAALDNTQTRKHTHRPGLYRLMVHK